MALFILSVVGSDRPGLTQALAGAVLSAGGNWRDSHLSLLGGLYVGSALVELPEAGVEALRAAVQAVDAQGLNVRIVPAAESPGETPGQTGEALRLTLVGQDRTGIVTQVTAALNGQGANIEAFKSWISVEPYSGIPLFNLDARLRLPGGVTVEAVQAALEDISAEVMVDIALTAEG